MSSSPDHLSGTIELVFLLVVGFGALCLGYDRGQSAAEEAAAEAAASAYETGYYAGYDDGEDAGKESGHESGYDDGYKVGRSDGFYEGAEEVATYFLEDMTDAERETWWAENYDFIEKYEIDY